MSDTYKDHGHPPGWENEHDPRCQACAQSELAAMPGSVSEFQSEVSKWAYQTFPHQTPHSKMAHLRKEIDELAENTSDGEEMADCFILLLNLAEMAGVDLMTEARRKMEINRKRKWGAPDADGVCHHVKQNAELHRPCEAGSVARSGSPAKRESSPPQHEVPQSPAKRGINQVQELSGGK